MSSKSVFLTALLGSTALMLIPAAGQSVTLPDVQVQGQGSGYAPTQPSLAKLTEPVLDTPSSIVTISRQVIEDRGATTLNDVLRNAPGHPGGRRNSVAGQQSLYPRLFGPHSTCSPTDSAISATITAIRSTSTASRCWKSGFHSVRAGIDRRRHQPGDKDAHAGCI